MVFVGLLSIVHFLFCNILFQIFLKSFVLCNHPESVKPTFAKLIPPIKNTYIITSTYENTMDGSQMIKTFIIFRLMLSWLWHKQLLLEEDYLFSRGQPTIHQELKTRPGKRAIQQQQNCVCVCLCVCVCICVCVCVCVRVFVCVEFIQNYTSWIYIYM